MLKKVLSIFLLFLISCGGGGGGGGDTTEPTSPAPVAIFTASPVSGSAPIQVNFLSASTDATSHSWDFDNDGSADASGASVSYTYNNSGSYSVSLTVTGPGGTDTNTKTDFITVSATAPVAFYAADQSSGTNPLRVIFTNSSTSYTSANWDFGDGNTSSESGTTVAHTYTTSGSYNVNLSVSGEGGTDSNNFLTVTVSDITTPAMILDSKYTTVSSGASIALDLKVLGVTGLAAAQATLSYDPNSITLNEVKKFKKISKVPLDVHIAKKNPDTILNKIRLDKNDNCCIHVENNFSINRINKINKKFNFGLAINLETSTVRLKKYLNHP